MVNISRVINALGKLEGSSARVTLSGKQFLQVAENKGASAEVSEVISGILSKHPKLKADVAYKVSEQGYTVGAVTLRNGKEVVGRGAASISGLGTEEAVLKMRLSAGKNGEIAQMSGWNNYAHTPKIQDYELATSMKQGVVETYAKAGEFGTSRTRIDIPKAVEAAGIQEEAALALKKGNNYLDKLWGGVRDLFAGKEVDMAKALGKKKVTPLNPKFAEVKMKDIQGKKIKEDFNFSKIKEDTSDLAQKLHFAPENCYKMPNGKMVNKEEFSKTMEEYFRLSSKQIKDALKDGRDKIADTKIKELKDLADQVKKQTGYEIKGDWTKYLGDAFKG